MNKLEEQIYHELSYNTDGGNLLEPKRVEEMARIATKIALDLAFKALKEGNRYQEDMGQELQERAFKQFIQDYDTRRD